jgi:hypothetical protein
MEMSELIKEFWIWKGKTVQLPVGGINIDVKIIDLRQVWNRVDAKVSPVSGNGEVWVEAKRLHVTV